MVHIKRLKINGFKSFSNQTTINFDEGFNTIVGANGSGKSNVFDAICFVLGRLSSKGLRAEKLGNLVFNGGKKDKPSSRAEVSIYLSNEKKELDENLDEIKISRIVKKDGQSTYFLNNVKTTRTEILMLLSKAQINPDGYNIILQGDITKIVNMTNVERRELIEEICDISGYEEKRNSALKKLDKIKIDLEQADLLIAEKTKYINELKSEKEAALKYSETKKSLEENTIKYLKVKNLDLKKNVEKKNEILEKKNLDYDKAKEDISKLDIKVKKVEEEILEIDKEIGLKSRDEYVKTTNEISKFEEVLKNLDIKISSNSKQESEIKSRVLEIEENIKKTKISIKNYEEELKDFVKNKNKKQLEITKIETDLNKLKNNSNDKSFLEIDEISKQIDEIQNQINEKNLVKQDNLVQIEKLNNKIELLEERLQKTQNKKKENELDFEKLKDNQNKIKNLTLDISKLISQNSELNSKYNNFRKQIFEVNNELSKQNMKNKNYENLISQNRALNGVLKFKNEDKNIIGTIIDLFTIDKKYSKACEIALGGYIFNLVVNDDKTAIKYVNYLKENKIGNLSFLPLNKVNANINLDESVLNEKGVINYLYNLINFEKKYEGIFKLVLNDFLLVETIEDARKIGIKKYKYISLDGDISLKTGAIRGGFNKKNNIGILKTDDSKDKIISFEKKLSDLENTISILKEDIEENEKILYDKRKEKIDTEADILRLEKLLEIDDNDNENSKNQIKNLLEDKAVVNNSLLKIDKSIKILEDDKKNLYEKRQKIKEKSNIGLNLNDINILDEKKENLKDELNKLIQSESKINIELNSILRTEFKNLEKIKVESLNSIEKISIENKELKNDSKQKIKEIEELKKLEKSLTSNYKNLVDKKEELKDQKENLLNRNKSKYEKFEKVRDSLNEVKYLIKNFEEQIQINETDLENYLEEVKINYQEKNNLKEFEEILKNIENEIQNKDSFDIKILLQKINNLKIKLNSFGTINLKAAEVYDKLKEEFDILTSKREKLSSEEKDIVDFIAEIDKLKKVKFLETFKVIEENFKKTFEKISSKGKVELLIEDEKNLFESGIEIRVRLSQKTYLDIKSLSGGEKTLTAIAFIFAIQEFNPASFYVLDEVDAALDIMNCEKFGKLVEEYTHKAQYIVVSHSEHFVQSSKTIFGVVMDKNKTSSVLSLDLKSVSNYIDE